MKCENCGKNEVTFIYQSNINGQVTEKHLCSECAEKLGYTHKAAARAPRMMRSFFGDSFFGDSFFDDFFSPMPSLFGRMNRLLENPFDDFFDAMPALSPAPSQESAQEEKKDDLVGKEDQSRFAYMREMNALKLEMKKAVHHEDFEKAAQLRDKIRALEAEHKEKKESK